MNRLRRAAICALMLATGFVHGQMPSGIQQVEITGSVVAYDWTLHHKLTHEAFYEQMIVRTTSRDANGAPHLLRVWYVRGGSDPVLPTEFFQGIWAMKLMTASSLGLCEKGIQWSTTVQKETSTGAKTSREVPRFRTPSGKAFQQRTEDIPCFTLLPNSWSRIQKSTLTPPTGRSPEPKRNVRP